MTISVLLVDDSAFMRVFTTDLIEREGSIKVVGTARNGQDALKKLKQLKPDVITMDVEMPVMNGIEAVQAIMQEMPTPIIMLSTLTTQGADATLQALRYGAFDFMAKPTNPTPDHLTQLSAELVAKIKAASSAAVHRIRPLPAPPALPARPASGRRTGSVSPITPPAVAPTMPPTVRPTVRPVSPQQSRPEAKPATIQNESAQVQPPGTPAQSRSSAPTNHIGRSPVHDQHDHGQQSRRQIVALGTSTGGPRALDYVLPQLPADLPAPIVIVQHMPPNFTKSLADRLDRQCALKVVEAQDGDVLEDGVVYIAPGGQHMTVKYRQGAYVIALDTSAKRHEHRPSVDVLFESVAALPNVIAHYVLLTGMGNDGAAGMALGKQAGAASTIAESQQTCVVFGMPKSAIELNCVDYVLDLPQIAPQIIACVEHANA